MGPDGGMASSALEADVAEYVRQIGELKEARAEHKRLGDSIVDRMVEARVSLVGTLMLVQTAEKPPRYPLARLREARQSLIDEQDDAATRQHAQALVDALLTMAKVDPKPQEWRDTLRLKVLPPAVSFDGRR